MLPTNWRLPLEFITNAFPRMFRPAPIALGGTPWSVLAKGVALAMGMNFQDYELVWSLYLVLSEALLVHSHP